MSDLAAREAKIYDALRKVYDPEINLSVMELGLIRKLDLKEDRSHVTMILTTPFCPYGPQLLEQVRRTAEVVGEAPATIEVGSELWDPTMMEEGAGGDWGLF